MNCSTSDLDGNHGIQEADSSLERGKVTVFVGKDAKVTRFDTETDTSGNILL
jgi:hypothetical protein